MDRTQTFFAPSLYKKGGEKFAEKSGGMRDWVVRAQKQEGKNLQVMFTTELVQFKSPLPPKVYCANELTLF
jgi:hypothetical protein